MYTSQPSSLNPLTHEIVFALPGSPRKSIRSFIDSEIDEENILEILEAARLAPSFQNRQCWRFIVVRDILKKRELALKTGLLGKVNFFIKEAPMIIVACADPGKAEP